MKIAESVTCSLIRRGAGLQLLPRRLRNPRVPMAVRQATGAHPPPIAGRFDGRLIAAAAQTLDAHQ